MAFRVRYVPLSPQGSKPRAMTSETELKPFEFVPLSQDIINKAKKGFEDLINELCPLPTPEQTSFAHNDFSNFASTSTFPIDDMQVSPPFLQPDSLSEEQHQFYSLLDQIAGSEFPRLYPTQDSSDVQMSTDTILDKFPSFEGDMTWNLTDEQLMELGSWEISPDNIFVPETASELEDFATPVDTSDLENMRKQMEELERQFYGEQNQIPFELPDLSEK
ncbi:hypothetical protein JR316_0012374 [Psilocybe cubensis]|uniref:Uncharacterized protein n=2 Tax=Psilocybe cubensis TaxID=181762 RepID=A0ACB8GHU0_PSICU|nr:hypothetical protein JR316_0012374 [Psilocybe cubensis]KAH9475263.1 hypothetical protein JR316_0012374 [Psilocybe cubensis]